MVEIETGYSLSKLTTIGTGGQAAAFARPESLASLEEVLRWAQDRELPSVVVGLGSNLRGRRVSAGSSSPRRSPAPPAAACG